MRRVAQVRGWIRPQGASPERVLNLMPVLARHGPSVLTRMHESALEHACALVQGVADQS